MLGGYGGPPLRNNAMVVLKECRWKKDVKSEEIVAQICFLDHGVRREHRHCRHAVESNLLARFHPIRSQACVKRDMFGIWCVIMKAARECVGVG